MRNAIKIIGPLLMVASNALFAEEIYDPLEDIKVVISLRGGVDIMDVGGSKTMNTSYSVDAPERFVVEDERQTRAVWGGLLGLEMPLGESERYYWQSGAAYYQTSMLRIHGTVEELSVAGHPARDFHYSVRNQRIMWENKLIAKLNQRFAVYVLGGLGLAVNEAYGYEEAPRSSDVGVIQKFDDRTKDSFSYSVGLGLEMELIEQLRLGAGYQFSNLGQIRLGYADVPNHSYDSLSQTTTKTNEFIANLTYAFNI